MAPPLPYVVFGPLIFPRLLEDVSSSFNATSSTRELHVLDINLGGGGEEDPHDDITMVTS